MSVSQERRCKRGGGYRMQANLYNPVSFVSQEHFDSEEFQKEIEDEETQ